ncbi:MAG: hypothetical protein K0R71_1201 [Bacillales bacterium]|jgi:hypothetical protein|nr:hypothetical protein [Bacillales bacterium]
MELIERYIYAVTKRLPETQRADVAKELRGNIEDMLSDQPTAKEVEDVLLELGEPSKLAFEYRGKKRYLIGPEYFDQYIHVLKLTCVILAAIGAIGTFIEAYVSHVNENSFEYMFEVFWNIIGSGFNGALHAFAWVTGIFFIFERFDIGFDGKYKRSEWSPLDLPEIPKKVSKPIHRSEIIGDLIGNTIWLGFLLFFLRKDSFIFTIDKSDVNSILAFFNFDHIYNTYFTVLIISALFGIFISILKWMRGYWSYWLASLQTGQYLLSFLILRWMLFDQKIYNSVFFANKNREELHESVRELIKNFGEIQQGIVAVAAIITVCQIVSVFYKAYKNQSK